MPQDRRDRVRTFADMSDLERLAQPIPRDWVQQKDMGGGRTGSYVNQGIVKQRLLASLRRPYDLTVVAVVRGDIPETTTGKGTRKEKVWPATPNAVVAVLARIDCEVDGRATSVEEYGTPEAAYQQPHDGERLKKALTDAVKRAAVHLGVGLEFPSKGTHFLPAALAAMAGATEADASTAEREAQAPDHDQVDPDDVHAQMPADGSEPDADTEQPAGQQQPPQDGSGPPDYAVRWLRTAGPAKTARAVVKGQADRETMLAAADELDRAGEATEHVQAGKWHFTLDHELDAADDRSDR